MDAFYRPPGAKGEAARETGAGHCKIVAIQPPAMTKRHSSKLHRLHSPRADDVRDAATTPPSPPPPQAFRAPRRPARAGAGGRGGAGAVHRSPRPLPETTGPPGPFVRAARDRGAGAGNALVLVGRLLGGGHRIGGDELPGAVRPRVRG